MKMFSNRAHRSHNRRNVDRQRRGKDVGDQGLRGDVRQQGDPALRAHRQGRQAAARGRGRARQEPAGGPARAAPSRVRSRKARSWKPETPAPAPRAEPEVRADPGAQVRNPFRPRTSAGQDYVLAVRCILMAGFITVAILAILVGILR
jgi:hypothetical protein